jgi:transcriptional regulator with XRE-family HTH domain
VIFAARSAVGGPIKGEGLRVSVTAHEIDAFVGRKLRDRREALGVSQGRLGRHLGLTFSQVQKYEKGTNRIGAGRLYQIAAVLGVPPTHFFEGLTEDDAGSSGGKAFSEIVDEDARALSRAFSAISDAGTRTSILALVKSLAEEDRTRSRRAR